MIALIISVRIFTLKLETLYETVLDMRWFKDGLQNCVCKQNAGLPRSGKKVWKMKIFQVREKSGKFGLSQGNWQKLEKVREKSGNFKILSEN